MILVELKNGGATRFVQAADVLIYREQFLIYADHVPGSSAIAEGELKEWSRRYREGAVHIIIKEKTNERD